MGIDLCSVGGCTQGIGHKEASYGTAVLNIVGAQFLREIEIGSALRFQFKIPVQSLPN